jgi:hypothetical protein
MVSMKAGGRNLEVMLPQTKPDANPKQGPRSHRGDLHPGKISGICARATAAGITGGGIHLSCYASGCTCDCHRRFGG